MDLYACLWSEGLGLSPSGNEEDGTGILAEEEHMKAAPRLQTYSWEAENGKIAFVWL